MMTISNEKLDEIKKDLENRFNTLNGIVTQITGLQSQLGMIVNAISAVSQSTGNTEMGLIEAMKVANLKIEDIEKDLKKSEGKKLLEKKKKD